MADRSETAEARIAELEAVVRDLIWKCAWHGVLPHGDAHRLNARIPEEQNVANAE